MSEPMTDARLAEIRQREQDATPGPWRWTGNTDVKQMELSTVGFGRLVVMNFARWGMNGAQPKFGAGRAWKPNPTSSYDFTSLGLMTKASELPVFEVAPAATERSDPRVYRADMVGVRHPDAEFIARSRRDVPALLAEVDRLRDENERLRSGIADAIKDVDGLAVWHQPLQQLIEHHKSDAS